MAEGSVEGLRDSAEADDGGRCGMLLLRTRRTGKISQQRVAHRSLS